MKPVMWGGRGGSYWAEHHERYDAMLAPMTPHLMAAAELKPADHVLDVGCGCGRTSLLAAETAASVLGVDIDAAMIAKAQEVAAGTPNVRFELTDAQTTPFEPVDVVLSQFGVMFFDDPMAAFGNLRRALRPGGRLVFVCWQGLAENENRMVVRDALHPHLPQPAPNPNQGALSLGDPDRVRDLLTTNGFTDVELTGVREQLPVGTSTEDAVSFLVNTPDMADQLAAAGPSVAAAATESLRAAYGAHETPDGVLLGGAAWVVTAR